MESLRSGCFPRSRKNSSSDLLRRILLPSGGTSVRLWVDLSGSSGHCGFTYNSFAEKSPSVLARFVVIILLLNSGPRESLSRLEKDSEALALHAQLKVIPVSERALERGRRLSPGQSPFPVRECSPTAETADSHESVPELRRH